jgi:hypothetical protein
MRKAWCGIALIAGLGIPGVALAQEEIGGADAAGRAGASVALPTADAALFSNPAGASFTDNLVTGVLWQLEPSFGNKLTAFAVDGTAPAVDGGVAAITTFSDEETRVETRTVASVPFGSRFSLGVTQTTLFRSSLPKGERTFLSADAGAALLLGNRFSVGVSALNLANSRVEDRPRLLLGGLSFSLRRLRFLAEGGLDITPDQDTKALVRGAAEWLELGPLALRGGYSFDTRSPDAAGTNRQTASLGLTYHDERSTFDIAYEQRLAGDGPSRLTVGIRFFLPGMNGAKPPWAAAAANAPATVAPNGYRGATQTPGYSGTTK